MPRMISKVASFSLNDPSDCEKYADLVNKPTVRVASVTDGLTKEGFVVRVVDYRECEGLDPYTPPMA